MIRIFGLPALLMCRVVCVCVCVCVGSVCCLGTRLSVVERRCLLGGTEGKWCRNNGGGEYGVVIDVHWCQKYNVNMSYSHMSLQTSANEGIKRCAVSVCEHVSIGISRVARGALCGLHCLHGFLGGRACRPYTSSNG